MSDILKLEKNASYSISFDVTVARRSMRTSKFGLRLAWKMQWA